MEGISYKSKGYITGSSARWIPLVTIFGMTVMFAALAIGLPVIVTMFVFLGAIYLGFRMITGEVIYTIDSDGITKEVSPAMLKNYWKKKSFQFYSWNNVKNFRAGEDAQRSLETFRFLTINMNNGDKLEINDKKGDTDAFKEFERVFRSFVEKNNAGDLDLLSEADIPLDTAINGNGHFHEDNPKRPLVTGQNTIIEKPNFYATFWAKLLTVIFIFVSVILPVMMITLSNFRLTNLFRYLFIIIPGTVYMTYRTFIKRG